MPVFVTSTTHFSDFLRRLAKSSAPFAMEICIFEAFYAAHAFHLFITQCSDMQLSRHIKHEATLRSVDGRIYA